MKLRMLIVIQETHGTEVKLRAVLDQLPYHYHVFFSPGDSPDIGGLAFLVPF